VLVVQSDAFNQSQIGTAVVVSLTSNLGRAHVPGNVILSQKETGLPRDSVVNVSHVSTIDRAQLDARVGRVSQRIMRQVEDGLRIVLDL
jgi:mRNA interferase MazF